MIGGGQGKSPDQIEDSGRACAWSALLFLAIIVAAYVFG